MFQKFASAAIIEAHIGQEPASLRKNAHRAVFAYTPREGYLYFRSRAISSRCNDNFDMFPAEEIKKSYASFIGKPVFVNHNNEDHRRARGMIIDAALHEDRNPDGSPDTWVEVLHELDAKTYPKLAKAILAGHIDRTSMGTDVQISKCSICHNEATSPLEYCQHIPGSKGKKVSTLDPRTGARETKLCFEICSGLSFFENSVLVEQPADPTAFFLGPVEAGTGLESLGMNKTASRRDPGWYYRQNRLPLKRTAAMHFCADDHPIIGAEHARGDSRAVSHEEFQQIAERGKQKYDTMKANSSPHTGLDDNWHHIKEHAYNEAQKSWGGITVDSHSGHMVQDGEDKYALTVKPHGRKTVSVPEDASREHFHAAMDHAKQHFSDVLQNEDHHLGVFHDDHHKRIDIDPVVVVHSRQDAEDIGSHTHNVGGAYHFKSGDGFWPPHVKSASVAPRVSYRTEYTNWLVRQAIQSNDESLDTPVNPHSMPTFAEYMRQASLQTTAGLAESEDYLQAHPVHMDHILSRVREAAQNPSTTHSGMKWYEDAHGMAKTMASHHKVPLHHVAGALGVYSASSPPSTNFHMASVALHSKRGIYSKTPKDEKGRPLKDETGKNLQHGDIGDNSDLRGAPMASKSDAEKVNRIFKGESYETAIGRSKTRNYARLIENPDNDHDVVIDRHAVAAAMGHNGSSGTPYNAIAPAIDAKNKARGQSIYNHIADTYRQATHHINTHPDFADFREHLKNSGLSHDGTVKPHQTQALAWIVQKNISDKSNRPNSGTQKDIDAFQDHYKDRYGDTAHHPSDSAGFFGGTREKKESGLNPFLAYGEIKAPQDVDTLRVETCPICGGTDFDGKQCVVCGYTSASSLFGDPDTSKAKEMSQYRETVDPQTGLPAGDPDFEEQQALEGDDGTDQPVLACENCGTEFEPQSPETVGEDPVPNQETEEVDEATGQPADGDICPVCEAGVVGPAEPSSPSEEPVDEDGDGIPDAEEEDPDAEDDDDEDEQDLEDEDDDGDDEDDDNPFPRKKHSSRLVATA